MLTLIFAISGFFNFVSGFGYGTYIFIKHRKERIYQIFYFSVLAFSLWSFGYGMWQVSDSKEVALLWCRIFSLGSTLIPITIFHWTAILLDMEKKEKMTIIFLYILSFLFIIFDFSPLFIEDVKPAFGFPWWPKPGIIYTIYLLFSYIGILLFYCIYLLQKNYKNTVGIKKEQIKYAKIAYLLPILGGLTNFPYWYNIPIPPYGNFLAFLYPVIMSYVISRYNLMDIRFIVGKATVYVFSIASVAVLSSLFLFLDNEMNFIPLNIFYVITLIISIYLYQIFFNFYEKVASKYFYYKVYSFQKVVAELGKKLSMVLDLKKLCLIIVTTLSDKIGLDKVAMLMVDGNTRVYSVKEVMGFDREQLLLLANAHFFSEYMAKNKLPLIYEEILALKTEETGKKEAVEIMKKNEIFLCIPIITGGGTRGLIILGKKISGDSYSVQDIELLTTLSSQISIALENARLYEEVDNLSKNLQQKVDEQTKDLKEAYEVEKSAREELEKLDDKKNQFLLAVQHHLRTPLTSIKWGSEALLGQNQTKKQKEITNNLKKSTEGLIKIVNEFLDITQFQLGKNVINLSLGVNIAKMFEEMLKDIKFEAKSKNIYVNINFKNKHSYIVSADEEKLRVALFNILDNAVKYTNKGGVDINLKKIDNLIRIIIKDTGIGIPKEDIDTLFSNVFERGKGAKENFVTGRGIGLYISDQIIKAHNGKVWAESEGEGKGSTFFIELPV